MWESNREDLSAVEGLGERLAAKKWRDDLFAAKWVAGEERYRRVEDYDLVLRAHCRLEEEG